jgi:integrase
MKPQNDGQPKKNALQEWADQTTADVQRRMPPLREKMARDQQEQQKQPAVKITKQQTMEGKRSDRDGLHKRRGIWEYSLLIDGKRRSFSTGTRNFQEARRIRTEMVKKQLEYKLPNERAKWPFEKLLERVLQDRRSRLDLAENSAKLEAARGRQLVRYFKDCRVCEIDVDRIKEYQTTRLKTAGPRTVNLEMKVLRFCLKDAKTWPAIAADFEMLKEADPEEPGKALEAEAEKLLLDVASSKPEWHVAYLCALAAAATTMRGCELRGLRIKDVDLMKRMVYVRRTKKRTGGKRDIPLNGDAMHALARLLERAAALGATAPDHYLLPRYAYRETRRPDRVAGHDPARPQGGWRTAWRSLRSECARRAGEAGIDPAPFVRLRFHDLRHHSITKLAEGEASDATIMSISGHLSRTMLEHYSHIRSEAKRAAVEALTGYIRKEAPPVPESKIVQ